MADTASEIYLKMEFTLDLAAADAVEVAELVVLVMGVLDVEASDAMSTAIMGSL